MAVTRDDVAQLAGVSPSTVSYVINNGPRPVSEETRAKVLWAIEQLGYQPNVPAQNLRRQRSNAVGLVFRTIERHLTHPYFVDLLTSVGEECAKQGFDLLLSSCTDGALEQGIYERLVGGRRVAGVIVTGVRYHDPRIAYLKAEGVPFVALGRPENSLDFPHVDVDGAHGTYQATKHLIDHGWRRIAFIGLSGELLCADDRLAGYRRALEEKGLPFRPELVASRHTTEAHGHEAMKGFLELDARPDAVVACSDELAFGAMNAAYEHGLSVGKDIGIIGFDDVPSAAYCTPPLTTIRQPIYEIGIRLCGMLIRLIKGEKPEQQQIILAPTLVIRESCGAHRTHA